MDKLDLRVKSVNAKFSFIDASDEQLKKALDGGLKLFLTPRWEAAYFAERALSADDEELPWSRKDFIQQKFGTNRCEINTGQR